MRSSPRKGSNVASQARVAVIMGSPPDAELKAVHWNARTAARPRATKEESKPQPGPWRLRRSGGKLSRLGKPARALQYRDRDRSIPFWRSGPDREPWLGLRPRPEAPSHGFAWRLD
jgi:hypothetical protein